MANKREIKNRLRGVRKTQQITRAMKMVATIKLRQAQTALANARPYAERMKALAAKVVAQLECLPEDAAFLAPRQVKNMLWVVVSSDRGLCGSMNANIFREVLRAVENSARPKQGKTKADIQLLLIGRRAKDFFKAHQNLHPEGLPYRVRAARPFAGLDAGRLGRECCELYRKAEFDRIDFFYNESSSALQHHPVRATLLPFELAGIRPAGVRQAGNIIFEPACAAMLADVICSCIVGSVRKIMLEGDVAEQAARMLMMDLATKNADELIATMQLTMNKLRQLSITTELEDITTGAEAIA